jgi:hypothetical protein
VDRRGHFVVKIRLDEFCEKEAPRRKFSQKETKEAKEAHEVSA